MIPGEMQIEPGEIVDQCKALGMVQFAGIDCIAGLGIAVDAAQIAPVPHVPDHDGFLVLGKLEQMGRQAGRFPAVTQVVLWPSPSA